MKSSVRQLKIWKFRLKQMDTDINYNNSVEYEIPSNYPWSSKHTNNHHDITVSSGDQYIRLIGLLAGSYPLWKLKKKLSVNHCTQTIEKEIRLHFDFVLDFIFRIWFSDSKKSHIKEIRHLRNSNKNRTYM